MFLKIAAISAIIFLTHALYCDYNNWWFLNGVEMVWSEKGYTGGGVRGKLRETKSSIRNFIVQKGLWGRPSKKDLKHFGSLRIRGV